MISCSTWIEGERWKGGGGHVPVPMQLCFACWSCFFVELLSLGCSVLRFVYQPLKTSELRSTSPMPLGAVPDRADDNSWWMKAQFDLHTTIGLMPWVVWHLHVWLLTLFACICSTFALRIVVVPFGSGPAESAYGCCRICFLIFTRSDGNVSLLLSDFIVPFCPR